jgi:hypothetical protein
MGLFHLFLSQETDFISGLSIQAVQEEMHNQMLVQIGICIYLMRKSDLLSCQFLSTLVQMIPYHVCDEVQ